MKIIGITGIFGSGKSTVGCILGELGAAVIDVDTIVHQLYRPGTEGFQRVTNLFGAEILSSDGCIDRKILAGIVFADKAVRTKLNTAIHPLVLQETKAVLAEHRRRDVRAAVVEAPLLIEAGWVPMVDEVWVTTASRKIIFRRLSQKCGMPPSSVLARIHAQLPVKEQIKHATHIINTDTSLERLKTKVKTLWQKIA